MITKIQKKIQKLYHLEQIPDVRDFLVTQKDIKNLKLMERPQVVLIPEKDHMRLGIYLGQACQKQTDIQLYTSLVEEISHFIYLFWNMTHDQPFSLLDVEIQGEIDKFLLLADQVGFSEKLIQNIFDRVLFRQNLPKDEKKRYKKANHLGKVFICKVMQMELCNEDILSFLRLFYRKGSIWRVEQIEKMYRFGMREKSLSY